ncbi:hypothetical protein SAMN04488060_1143 [Qipengyuania nanhaisediminis]|uniref:Uncharacterized protein n=1 Tax=Qipengyuania nanhaisediminis TaxID=604088 RepID=A0A1I5M630_9SPHN|nr:hypothetical protein SAMN04488060_1143 [Qipengyuania nanhaisediminis]
MNVTKLALFLDDLGVKRELIKPIFVNGETGFRFKFVSFRIGAASRLSGEGKEFLGSCSWAGCQRILVPA